MGTDTGNPGIQEISERLERIEKLLDASVARASSQHSLSNVKSDWKIDDEENFLAEFGSADARTARLNTDLVTERFKHRWSCNVFNQCETEYYFTVYIVNKANGRIIRNNLIQTATKLDLGIDFWSTSPYGTVEQKGDAKFDNKGNGGIGSYKHQACYISSCVNFYGDWGSVSWTWDSATQVCY